MSEARRKTGNILLKFEGNKNYKIELFPAAQWKYLYRLWDKRFIPKPAYNKPEWWGNKYRVRINGVWFCKGGAKYSFLNGEQVKRLIVEHAKL